MSQTIYQSQVRNRPHATEALLRHALTEARLSRATDPELLGDQQQATAREADCRCRRHARMTDLFGDSGNSALGVLTLGLHSLGAGQNGNSACHAAPSSITPTPVSENEPSKV